MFTKKRLDDYVSVYQSYLNKFESNGENGSNTDGYKYYKFVSSPQAVVLLDFGRVKFSDIKGNKNPTVPPKLMIPDVSNIWKTLSGTNTPDGWKIQLGSKYSETKRNNYSEIEKTRTGQPGTKIISVTPGLKYKINSLINNSPKVPDVFSNAPNVTPTPTSGTNYVTNMQNDAGISSETDFLTKVIEQNWLDSFRLKSDATGSTINFSSYTSLFEPETNNNADITKNAIGVEWFGYFRPPNVSTQYSFTFSTSNGGNFLMWLGNKAICEYTPVNADIIFPNVEFTPNPPVREPKYYPIRIQYYANSNSDLSRVFSFGIKNLTTKDDLDLKDVLFTINDGKYFPELQYLSFVSTSDEKFSKAAMVCYTNDLTTEENRNTFYDFINSQKYITLNKTNDRDAKTNQDEFGIIEANKIFYSQVSIPNNPLSSPNVFSIYRMDVDMRMNQTFQINTKRDPATNSFTMNSIDDKLTTLGNTYTTLPNYYPDNPSAGINATAGECKKQCNESSTCNWYFAYKSNDTDRCVVDSRNEQPLFNQVRPTGGNIANSSVDDKTSSLNLRNFSFPKSTGCGKNSVLLEESEPVLNTQIYTDSFPYSTYVIDPYVIPNVNNSGKCSDETYLKLNAEAKNILAANTLYQEDGKYKHPDGTMKLSNYPPYTDTNFWSSITELDKNEGFSTVKTNALADSRNNALNNVAKEQRLLNTNEQINSTYSNLSTNIQDYSKLKTFMENDVNYDLSGNTLLHFRNARKPTLREQNALDSNEGGMTQNSLYILGTITAASLLILAVLLGRE